MGVHEDAAYTVAAQSRADDAARDCAQVLRAGQAELFRRLAAKPNVSAVARELGFTRVTCYSWAYKAGARTSEARKANPSDAVHAL